MRAVTTRKVPGAVLASQPMNGVRAIGAYAVVAAILSAALGVALLVGPYRAIERSDYMTYHVAARIVLAGDGDCLYDPACQADAQRELIGVEPSFEGGALPYNSPPWFAALIAPLGALPLPAAFAIFTLLGLAVLAAGAWLVARPLGPARPLAPILLLTAWPTVMGAVRGQSTLLVAGLLAVSVAASRYRSGGSLGLSALKPTLGPLWGAWLTIGGHPRAVVAALAVIAALIGLSLVVVGPAAVAAYPTHLFGVAGEGAAGVHPTEMMNWRGAAARLGLGEWLTWSGTALTLTVVALAWWRSRMTEESRELGAAIAFLATPLVLPHANQHEAILASLGVIILLAAVRDHPARGRLGAAAVGLHAVLWAGPSLGGEVAAWLLFAATLGWFGFAVWLAVRRD